MRFILAIAALFALAAPAFAQTKAPLSGIRQFTVDDLQNASADAKANNDTRHGPCWDALVPVAQGVGASSLLPSKPGLASLAQKYFDISARPNLGLLPDNVVQACALTMADLRIDAAKLAALVGLKAAALALPVLP